MTAAMNSKRSGRSLALRTRPSVVSIIVGVLVGAVLWEAIAQVLAAVAPQGDRVMPSLVTAATSGLLGVSDYWSGGLGIESTAQGGAQSITGALLALGVNAATTLLRVLVGLVLALVLGIGLGLVISAVRPVRYAVSGVAEMIRMLPGLAMAPLFTLWFGATDFAAVAFVVFGVAFVVLVGTTGAVANLRPEVLEYPRTLGVRGLGLWTRVVLPAILPELRGTLIFGALVGWTSVLAAEMYGLTSGLGWMLAETLRFSLVDRMLVVAVVFSGLALVTMKLLGAAIERATKWA
ncbi:MAG: ABC transporter permease [Pseudoclavibacter sp.]